MSKRNKEITKAFYDRVNANHYDNYTVKEDTTLMEFLTKTFSGSSRTKVKQILTQRMVYVDHQITTRYDYPLKKGQLVQILKKRNIHEFRNDYVKIIYEDAFLIVVEKKNGIITNAPEGAHQNSVKRILDEYVKRKSRSISVHTVHRLDRETSGLMIFAKRRDVQQILTDHWHEIVVDRRYIAVAEGLVEKNSDTIMSWLTDNRMFVTTSSPVDNGGKQAITHYNVIKRGEDVTMLDVKLDTGRKNQIRVHAQDIGHPIVGDYKYGAQTDPISRIALHAYKLDFYHPITNEYLCFSTPIPENFESLFKK